MTEVRDYFEKNYGYVDLDELSDKAIENYLNLRWIKDLSFERKMDCLYDYILSQDLCDVQE